MKKLYRVASELGLAEADGCVFFGNVNGMQTVLQFIDVVKELKIFFGVVNAKGNMFLENKLESIVQNKLIKSYEIDDNMITMTVKYPIFASKIKDKVNGIFSEIMEFFARGNVASGCFISGEVGVPLHFMKVGKKYYFLSEHGRDALVAEFEQNKQEIDEKTENFAFGLIGAVGGALIGGVAWFVIGLLGIYEWIAGIITITLAFKGYQKFAGKVGKIATVFVYLISVVTILVASFSEYAWNFYKIFSAEFDMSVSDVLSNTWYFIVHEPEIRGIFIKDLIIGVGIVVVGGIFMIKELYDESSGKYEVKIYDEK